MIFGEVSMLASKKISQSKEKNDEKENYIY